MRSAGIGLCDGGPSAALAPLRRYAQVFAGRPDQVRAARRFMTGIMDGCPVAGDSILCLSELAANAVIHSSSRRPGGAFAALAEILDGSYVRIEVHDQGGPWDKHVHRDDHPHGLDIVARLAAEFGVDGSAMTGWISWVRLDWPCAER
jgi:hypothetical protein